MNMTEDITTPNAVRQDYKQTGIEIIDSPERIYASGTFWAVIVCIISGYAFALAVFGG